MRKGVDVTLSQLAATTRATTSSKTLHISTRERQLLVQLNAQILGWDRRQNEKVLFCNALLLSEGGYARNAIQAESKDLWDPGCDVLEITQHTVTFTHTHSHHGGYRAGAV